MKYHQWIITVLFKATFVFCQYFHCMFSGSFPVEFVSKFHFSCGLVNRKLLVLVTVAVVNVIPGNSSKIYIYIYIYTCIFLPSLLSNKCIFCLAHK